MVVFSRGTLHHISYEYVKWKSMLENVEINLLWKVDISFNFIIIIISFAVMVSNLIITSHIFDAYFIQIESQTFVDFNTEGAFLQIKSCAIYCRTHLNTPVRRPLCSCSLLDFTIMASIYIFIISCISPSIFFHSLVCCSCVFHPKRHRVVFIIGVFLREGGIVNV